MSATGKYPGFSGFCRGLGRETLVTSGELLKVTVPAVVVTKILAEFGLIDSIARALEPVMGMMGLGGELGLVWATAILTQPYAAVGVYASLAPSLMLSGADVTVLCSVILIAHSLPVELSITKKGGAGVIPIGLIRLCGALGYGIILHRVCTAFDLWQEPAMMLFTGIAADQTLLAWGWSQVLNIALIVVVICLILLAMRCMKAIGFLDLLESALKPLLPAFGMSHRAAPVTVIGMIMGIAYGGALIIRETTGGTMDRRETFNSLALMSLSHGLVEDTLLMMALGAKLSGILWGRVLFSLVFIYLLVRVVDLFTARSQRP